jgi:signal transduction histidine kinase
MRDHVIKGIELDNAKQPRAALRELEAGMQICERMQLLDRFADDGKNLIFRITIPMYVLSAGIYDRLGETEEAIKLCRKSMAWLEYCDSTELRERYAYEVCLIMMGHRRLEMAQRFVARTYRDADVLNKHDDALLCAAFMLEIESTKYATLPPDNPWIEKGKKHYGNATQPEAKTLFLSFLHKAYLKANMHDEAKRLEKQVRQARANGINPFLNDNKVTPYDTAYITTLNREKGLSSNEQTTAKDEQANSTSIVPKTISKIQYIYRQHNGLIIAIGSVLAIVILTFIAYAIRQRYLRRHSQQESERQLNRRFLEGMEQERSRLAKELHDGVSNQLFAIEMKLSENDGVSENARHVRRLVNESREQVRRVSHELMPPEFTFTHLGEVIENFIEEMDGANGIAMHFDSQSNEECYKSIPPAHALEIYRIVQEAVTNAVKHSAPSDIYILIKEENNTMIIRITDNGTPRQGGTHGIGQRTMNQRADSIGATLTVERIPYASVVTLQYVKKK